MSSVTRLEIAYDGSRVRRLGPPARAAHGAGGAGGGVGRILGGDRGRLDGRGPHRRRRARHRAGRELRARTGSRRTASPSGSTRCCRATSRCWRPSPLRTGFDARRWARSRSYRYRVLAAPTRDPFEEGRALWWPYRARPRGARRVRRLDRRRARLHGVHADPDRARPLRARRAGRSAWEDESERILAFTDRGRRVHAEHDPRPGRDDARGRRRQAHRGGLPRAAPGAPRERAGETAPAARALLRRRHLRRRSGVRAPRASRAGSGAALERADVRVVAALAPALVAVRGARPVRLADRRAALLQRDRLRRAAVALEPADLGVRADEVVRAVEAVAVGARRGRDQVVAERVELGVGVAAVGRCGAPGRRLAVQGDRASCARRSPTP